MDSVAVEGVQEFQEVVDVKSSGSFVVEIAFSQNGLNFGFDVEVGTDCDVAQRTVNFIVMF